MMLVVDTSVWIDFFTDRPTDQVAKLAGYAPARDIVVGDIVLMELLRGARDDGQAARYERNLRRFRLRPFLDPELAVAAAGHYLALRAKGVAIRKAPDLIIGTYCIRHDLPLLHNDRDFAVMAEHLGLREH